MPAIIGISGTRAVGRHASYVRQVARVIGRLPAGTLLVTGGCIGVDAVVTGLALRLKLAVHTVLPANRDQVDPFWESRCQSWEAMPDGTDYRARNRRIVQLADALIAFPEYPEHDTRSARSGTWMTYRIAEQAGLPTTVVVLAEGVHDA